MPKSSQVLFFKSVALILALVSLLASAHSEPKAFSIENMLSMEAFGSAEIDSSGQWLLFERRRPYDQLTDYSYRTYAYSSAGSQVWRYNLKEANAAEVLPNLNQESDTFLQGFSPGGRYAAIIQYRRGELSISAYDLVSERSVKFPRSPLFSRRGESNPVWLSDSQLAYTSPPVGQQSMLTSVRPFTASQLIAAWEGAWNGDVVTASEVRSHPQSDGRAFEDGHLIVASAETGETEILAEGLYVDLRVSPDGKHLAALQVSKPRPIDFSKPVESDPRRHSLVVFDLQTGGKNVYGSELEFVPYSIVWSSNSRQLAAFGWGGGQRPSEGRFQRLDILSGRITPFDHRGLELASERERGAVQRPERAVFLGERLAVFARPVSEGASSTGKFTFQDFKREQSSRTDWYALNFHEAPVNLTAQLPTVSGVPVHAGTDHMAVLAENGVYRIVPDGSPQRLTPPMEGKFRLIQPSTFSTHGTILRPEFSDEVIVVAVSEQKASAVLINLRDGQEGMHSVIEVPSEPGAILAGSLHSKKLLLSVSEGLATTAMIVMLGDEVGLVEIARVNDHLAGTDLGTWKTITYSFEPPSPDDSIQSITSCILLPPGYDPASPPPLIVDVYPDARPRCGLEPPRVIGPNPFSPYLWAGKGYAYARLTTPRRLIAKEEGPISGIAEVVDAGVAAIAEAGLADRSRSTLFGFSQGGVSALYTASMTETFSQVIAINSWANLLSHYFGGTGIYSYVYGEFFGDFARYESEAGTDFALGVTPFDDPEIYIRNSPVYLAPNISVPVLLIHSDMDGFSLSQFDEMFGALLRAGKEARYVRYWGEGHGPSSPENIRDMWSRMEAFISETSQETKD